jgi:hypothetical protein
MPAGILEIICLNVERKTRCRVDIGSGFLENRFTPDYTIIPPPCGDASMHDGRDACCVT